MTSKIYYICHHKELKKDEGPLFAPNNTHPLSQYWVSKFFFKCLFLINNYKIYLLLFLNYFVEKK